MQPTRIKICGITRPQDALAAALAGADAVGMVFHEPAKRNISIERAREILAALPPFVTPVGLFVDRPTPFIMQTARELGVRHVQLHGHEAPEQLAELRDLIVTKAIRVERGKFVQELGRWRDAIAALRLTNLRGIVVETASGAQEGGSGIANDWETIESAMRQDAFRGLPALIVAGGLTPQTVGDVVRRLRPWAVDVSSGVESAPNCKSQEKIEAFVLAVRQANA